MPDDTYISTHGETLLLTCQHLRSHRPGPHARPGRLQLSEKHNTVNLCQIVSNEEIENIHYTSNSIS